MRPVADSDLCIVVPWCDRPEIGRTLPFNVEQAKGHSVEFVIVNLGGNERLVDAAVRHARSSGSVRLFSVPAAFNRALACNLGLALCRSRLLFVLDADVELRSGTLSEVISLVSRGCPVTIGEVLESGHQTTNSQIHLRRHSIGVELVDGRTANVDTNVVFPRRGSRRGLGLIAATADDLRAVGGWNSQLSGWGFEDCDLAIRLQLAGCMFSVAGSVRHLSHGDGERSIISETKEVDDARNAGIAFERYAAGLLGGTLLADVDHLEGALDDQ